MTLQLTQPQQVTRVVASRNRTSSPQDLEEDTAQSIRSPATGRVRSGRAWGRPNYHHAASGRILLRIRQPEPCDGAQDDHASNYSTRFQQARLSRKTDST